MSVTTQLIESPAMRAVIAERDAAYAELERGGRPGVSVCIPCFNQGEYIDTALDSILAQTVPALEVIIIDDGSTDAETKDKVATLVNDDSKPRIRSLRITNRGLPNARNTALMLARGEWFLPVDSDDWLEPTFIEKTLAEAARTGADVILTGLQEHGEHRNGAYFAGFDRPWHEVTVELLVHDYNRFYYASLFRTRALREVGGYNGLMAGAFGKSGGYEDWDLTIDLMKRGVKYAAVDEHLLNYRTRSDSMLSAAEANRAALTGEIFRHHGYA